MELDLAKREFRREREASIVRAHGGYIVINPQAQDLTARRRVFREDEFDKAVKHFTAILHPELVKNHNEYPVDLTPLHPDEFPP
jgi:hypothetical protein